jgi:hypothetical protein
MNKADVLYDEAKKKVYYIDYVGTRIASGTDNTGNWIILRIKRYHRIKAENEIEGLILVARLLRGTGISIPESENNSRI